MCYYMLLWNGISNHFEWKFGVSRLLYAASVYRLNRSYVRLSVKNYGKYFFLILAIFSLFSFIQLRDFKRFAVSSLLKTCPNNYIFSAIYNVAKLCNKTYIVQIYCILVHRDIQCKLEYKAQVMFPDLHRKQSIETAGKTNFRLPSNFTSSNLVESNYYVL